MSLLIPVNDENYDSHDNDHPSDHACDDRFIDTVIGVVVTRPRHIVRHLDLMEKTEKSHLFFILLVLSHAYGGLSFPHFRR